MPDRRQCRQEMRPPAMGQQENWIKTNGISTQCASHGDPGNALIPMARSPGKAFNCMGAKFAFLFPSRWLTRCRLSKPMGDDVTTRHALRRFAKLRTSELSFASAFALGMSLDHARSQDGSQPKYDNGAGLAGDRDAIAGEFQRAVAKAKGGDLARG